MNVTSLPLRVSADEASKLPLQASRLSALIANTGDVEVRHYAPRGHDAQTPHDRDELYVVISGGGSYACAGHRVPFGPGDLLFAAAHSPHRFESFSDDFACWVVFFGPVRAAPADRA